MDKKIEQIDKNFSLVDHSDKVYVYHDPAVRQNIPGNPFKVYGFPKLDANNNVFCRLEIAKLDKFTPAVKGLSWHTSGGAIRFKSNTKDISLRIKLRSGDDMSHMPRSGSSGVDIFKGEKGNRRFIKAAIPGSGVDNYESVFENINPEGNFEEWTLYMPLYNGIKAIEIGLDCDSSVECPSEYTFKKPLVFYGSSITQGGCASRPGNNYTHILGRWTDAPIINLGFSGSARGEPEMAEFISELDMQVFIMDYDYNAPDPDYLKKTHEKFFNFIRNKQPDLPVILVTKPDFEKDIEDSVKRRQVILQTYKNAINSGDRNVYYIDGESLFGTSNRDACTVDGVHPNDLGFMRMAENIFEKLKEVLNI